MESQLLSICPSKNTPQVFWGDSEFTFKGVSYPENADKFYDPIFNVIKSYLKNKKSNDKLKIVIDFEYFNTSTARMLYKLFSLFNEAVNTKDCLIEIDWVYEFDDFDMIDSGKDFNVMFKYLDFNLTEKAA
jgi:hypothetical protein